MFICRRDSSSSLSTASEAKGRREGSLLVKQDVEKEDEDSDSSGKVGRGRKKRPKEEEDEDFGSDLDSTGTRKKKVGPVLNIKIFNYLLLRYFSPAEY